MSGYISIDGTEYKVPIISLDRKADKLYKYANRTANGNLRAELIGVYKNYSIVFGRNADSIEYANLYDVLTDTTVFHEVTLPDEKGLPITDTFYFANVKDKFVRVKDSYAYVKGLSVDVIAKDPARTP